MEKTTVWLISVYTCNAIAMFSSYFVDTETLEGYSQIRVPKNDYKCSAQGVASFSYVW